MLHRLPAAVIPGAAGVDVAEILRPMMGAMGALALAQSVTLTADLGPGSPDNGLSALRTAASEQARNLPVRLSACPPVRQSACPPVRGLRAHPGPYTAPQDVRRVLSLCLDAVLRFCAPGGRMQAAVLSAMSALCCPPHSMSPLPRAHRLSCALSVRSPLSPRCPPGPASQSRCCARHATWSFGYPRTATRRCALPLR